MEPSLKYVVKTTDELEAAEISSLRALFSEVFQRALPEDVFLRKYRSACFGYSIHSLMYVDGNLAGAVTAIPFRYSWFGEPRIFAIEADLMISARSRGRLDRMKQLTTRLCDRAATAEIAFVFGCTREEMRPVHEIVSRWRVLGSVRYYIAPMGNGWLGRMLGEGLTGCQRLARVFRGRGDSARAAQYAVEKIADPAFLKYRYGVFPIPYKSVPLPGGGTAVYATELYYPVQGVPHWLRFGLLIDVTPLTRENLDAAVRLIRTQEPDLHALAHQGYLPFQPLRMLQIPQRLEKKAWFVMGRILRSDLVDERIYDISNWCINLSNGDLV